MEILASGWHIVVPVVLTALEVIGLASAWHAAQNVRTSQAAVAWAAGLVAMPLLMVPMYWIFGRSRFGGYREALREAGQQHQASVEAIRRELDTHPNVASAVADRPIARLADVLDTPLSFGNDFELLIDGRAFFDDLLRQIESAEHYVYAQFYILRDDDIGRQFAEALARQARAGKVVRLLYDEVGCLLVPRSYFRRLRDAGVEVLAFNTRQGWSNRFQLNFRNHRKLLVVDGRRAIVGGLNVGDEYLGRARWATHWRDTALRVDGPAARKLQAVFASDYYWASRRDMPEARWEVDAEEPSAGERDASSGAGVAAVCRTGPADRRARATMMFATAAAAATRRLWISSPYLVPDETSVTALSMARARGVDVRVLVPSKADRWLVYLAGFYYERVLESIGVPVYRYRDGFLHQKCVLVDDDLALIGSTNLDNRSLHLNFELMLAVGERPVVAQVAEMLERDFARASTQGAEPERLRPWYFRIGTVVARLFSPVL